MTPGGGINITIVTYNNVAQIGLVCCNTKIDSLDPLATYFLDAFEMLEKCVDDPSLNVDDIGEIVEQSDTTIVEESPYTQ